MCLYEPTPKSYTYKSCHRFVDYEDIFSHKRWTPNSDTDLTRTF